MDEPENSYQQAQVHMPVLYGMHRKRPIQAEQWTRPDDRTWPSLGAYQTAGIPKSTEQSHAHVCLSSTLPGPCISPLPEWAPCSRRQNEHVVII